MTASKASAPVAKKPPPPAGLDDHDYEKMSDDEGNNAPYEDIDAPYEDVDGDQGYEDMSEDVGGVWSLIGFVTVYFFL